MRRPFTTILVFLLGAGLCAGCGGSRALYCSACSQGQAVCDPAGELVACEGPDSDGCLRWAPPRPCKTGECDCENPCQPGETLCHPDGGLVSCLGPDADGHTYWSAAEQCPAGQSCNPAAARCLDDPPDGCADKNECDYYGQKKCMSVRKYRECKPGDDGCLKLDCST
jgi:hypothetical protein